MASADQMKALVKSHAEGDDDRFYSVALQVAAKASRSGHGRFAQELRDLVDSLQESARHRAKIAQITPVTQPRGELASLLSVSYPSNTFPDFSFGSEVRGGLKRILHERKQRKRLESHGFTPVSRVLLVGPPGTGKTSSAHVLAGELGLPLFTVRLDGLISKYMGESAAKLRLIFDALTETRGVYLFDEVDALAGARTAGNDVGEIRRILNSFLQFLESDDSESLLLAATNHPELLDDAVFRRFEMVLQFPLPSPEVVREVVRNRLASFQLDGVDWDQVAREGAGLSHAEITIAVETAAKKAILEGDGTISTLDLVVALRSRHQTRGYSPSP